MNKLNLIISDLEYFLQHSRFFAPVRYLLWKKKLRPLAEKTIQEFNKPYSEALCLDMIWQYCEHMITMPQYFIYECDKHSYSEIEKFIGNREIAYYAMKINNPRKADIFRDKYETYCAFKKYYGREIIQVTSEDDLSEFVHFMMLHKTAMVKPINSSFGRGVKLVCAENKRKATAVFSMMLCLSPDGFVAEERIIQCDELAAFHPQSVNTVRLITMRHEERVRIWYQSFRIGKGKSVVDNLGADGIGVIVDSETGTLGDAYDMMGNIYEVHPDTGKQLKGYRIPRWNEAVDLAKELAQVVPDVRYVGWDLALTDNGWIMIEGNDKSQQNIDKIGRKAEFIKELKEIQHHK